VKGNGPYPWTDITWLLDKQGVTWKYYVGDGTNLNCPQYPCVPNDPKQPRTAPHSRAHCHGHRGRGPRRRGARRSRRSSGVGDLAFLLAAAGATEQESKKEKQVRQPAGGDFVHVETGGK
jgi:hypothetical protein